jgi:hypothetical protein
MKEARTVAVLGPIPRDRVITHQGVELEKYGCALYTTAALSALFGEHDRIVPIVHLAPEDVDPVSELLGAFANVDTSHLAPMAAAGDVVELRYLDQNERREQQTSFMSPITPDDVEPVIDADAFVCVPITDYQVGPTTLAHIRAHGRGLVIYDGHGPTVSLVRGGERVPRLWVDRDLWLPGIDVLKMNLDEAGRSLLTSRSMSTLGEPVTRDQLPELARQCLARGVRAVCITLDEHGCAVYAPGPDGSVREVIVPGVPVQEVVDTTGCGDSFAAGLAYGFLERGDIVTGARFGNAMGAQRCGATELAAYRSLASTTCQIAEVYGATAK